MRDDRASHERPARRSGLGGIILVVATVSLLSAAAIAAAGFDDDDGNVHEPAIDALAGEGILEGTECGEGAICPREPFERWVMAVWLIRALGESPSTAANRFVDVDAESVVGALRGTSGRAERNAGMRHGVGPLLPRGAGQAGSDGDLPGAGLRSRSRT